MICSRSRSCSSPTITDRGDGHYWIVPAASHRDTLGESSWKFAAAGAVIAPRFENVVAYDAQLEAVGANQQTPLNDAGIRSAIGLAAADLDDQLGVLSIYNEYDVVAAMQAVADSFKADVSSVTVGSLTPAALALFLTVNTGESAAVPGSVGKISQGAAGDNTDQLNRIEAQTSKIIGAVIQVISNVNPGGRIELHHGHDHTVALGNAVTLPVSDPGGVLHGLMSAIGAGNLSISTIHGSDSSSQVLGTVQGLSHVSDVLTITLEFSSAETSKGVVGPLCVYDIFKTDTTTRTYVSGKLTFTRDAG